MSMTGERGVVRVHVLADRRLTVGGLPCDCDAGSRIAVHPVYVVTDTHFDQFLISVFILLVVP